MQTWLTEIQGSGSFCWLLFTFFRGSTPVFFSRIIEDLTTSPANYQGWSRACYAAQRKYRILAVD